MPALNHLCPKCSLESPCFFSEGEIVSLKEGTENEPAPWTGIVLEVNRDEDGRMYRVLWGSPPTEISGAVATARRSGAHRGNELQRFLVPQIPPGTEILRGGGGGSEGLVHRLAPPAP